MSEPNGGPQPPDSEQPVRFPDDPEHGLEPEVTPAMPPALSGRTTPPSAGDPDDDDEEDGMLRMSFLEHLEELRSRIIQALIGGGVAFAIAMVFAVPIFEWVIGPGKYALQQIGDGDFVALSPMERFNIMWIWAPFVASIYLAAPWILYQVWAFIAPGLYPRERRWAGPFILITVGLFVAGGAFGYYIVLPFALTFLFGIGESADVKNAISIDFYFTNFVNVMLGISILFELPVVVFFLTLLRVVTPAFLIRNSRYAILAIVILAAVVTPTPDPVNLALFAIPMILLFFLGVFASYLLVLHREKQKFPWRAFFIWLGIVMFLVGATVAVAVFQYGYRLVPGWPFLVR